MNLRISDKKIIEMIRHDIRESHAVKKGNIWEAEFSKGKFVIMKDGNKFIVKTFKYNFKMIRRRKK